MSGIALRERLALLDELRQIVSAMRNVAYAELQRLNRLQPAQQKAEQVVIRALADTLRANPARAQGHATAIAWLVVGAERGFCGGFNDRLADALATLRDEQPNARWYVAGARMRPRAEAVLAAATWLRGCSGPDEAAACVDHWLSALVSVTAAQSARAPELWVMHHAERGVVRRRLLPLPELPAPTPGPAPLRQLPLDDLVATLLAQCLRVSLLAAVHQSLRQENHWRLAQMQRAGDYLDDAGDRLRRRYFRQRQSEITGELETLMASLSLQRGRPFGSPPGGSRVPDQAGRKGSIRLESRRPSDPECATARSRAGKSVHPARQVLPQRGHP